MHVRNASAASVKNAWTCLSANIHGAGRRDVHGAMLQAASSSLSNWTLDEASLFVSVSSNITPFIALLLFCFTHLEAFSRFAWRYSMLAAFTTYSKPPGSAQEH
jgi:hypothetical protein